ERFAVDVGFTDPIAWTPDTIRTSDFLSFADIAPIDLPAIPLPQHIAEKVHAYTGTYGPSDQPSTRPKDLVDILLIADSEAIEASDLRTALTTTFEARGHQPLPAKLPPPPPKWEEPYRRLAEEIGIEPGLDAAFSHAAAFLDPVLAHQTQGQWDVEAGMWTATGNR
ncbi:MAG: nucleotidyl transferase AbiEii/AbiGii toxin family protein, partial [Solirubrobacterales bacterium]|nr:nucleotidyl transferase AbiEii/AbiGii toxin family protein [Solirubrobacterales bacterium]